MANFAKIIHINQEEIPQKMFNKTYSFFSFDIISHGHLKDCTPLWLTVAEQGHTDKCVVITDLDSINDVGRQRLVEFLKSITIAEDYLPIKHDICLAKYKYDVDMKVI